MNLGKRRRSRADAEKDFASMWFGIFGGGALVPVMCTLPAITMMIIVCGTIGGGLVVAWVLEQIFRPGK